MNWAHLPVAGGIYDQHPQLLADWMVMFEAQARKQKREHDKREAEAAAQRNRGGKGRR